MKKAILYILLLYFVSSCHTARQAGRVSLLAASRQDSTSSQQEEHQEKVIYWYQHISQDTTDTIPFAWLVSPLGEPSPGTKGASSWGAVKITTSKTTTAAMTRKSNVKKSEEQKQEQPTIKTKTDWKVTAFVSALAVFLCQCVRDRKKIASFLRKCFVV